MHEAEDDAKAGCYEAKAEHFGLETTLASRNNIPGELLIVMHKINEVGLPLESPLESHCILLSYKNQPTVVVSEVRLPPGYHTTRSTSVGVYNIGLSTSVDRCPCCQPYV